MGHFNLKKSKEWSKNKFKNEDVIWFRKYELITRQDNNGPARSVHVLAILMSISLKERQRKMRPVPLKFNFKEYRTLNNKMSVSKHSKNGYRIKIFLFDEKYIEVSFLQRRKI